MIGPALCATALAQLLPMHLWLDRSGAVLSIGPTLAKLLPDTSRGVTGHLIPAREQPGSCLLSVIDQAVEQRTRLFLRLIDSPDLVLRGHGVRAGDGSTLLNLGFGIGLHMAIQSAGLTDDDFAPSELAMELLFLHEANRGVLTELSRFNDQLAQSRELALLQAQTDPLTGLHNRRGLEIALTLSLRTAELPDEAPQPFALVHLDLDHFKQVNDQLGHQAGDDLLRAVGAVLRSHIRKADTAARIGGDEFVLILRGMTSRPALEGLSGRIIASINALSPPALVGLSVSASLGVVIWAPGGSTRPDEVLAQADRALYMSKGSGRSRVTII